MKESIETLKKCQTIDQEIYSLNRTIHHIPERIIELDSRFESEKDDLQKLEAHLKQTKLTMKQKEGNLREEEDQIQKYDAQLTQVKTNKEYASLQGEITTLKKQTSTVEDEIIVLLDEVAGMEKEINEEKARLDGKKREIDQEKADLEKTKKESQAKIETLTQERTTILEPLDKEVRSVYERIVVSRGGNALAKVVGENCMACSMVVRPQIINDAQLGEKIVMCESCSRILYTE